MIPIYQPNEVSPWRKRITAYSAMRRGLLFEDTGGGFVGLSVFEDTDSGTYVAPPANPTGGGSGPTCCCCECQYCQFSKTPEEEVLIASGITYASGCYVLDGISSDKIIGTPADPNGTFNLLKNKILFIDCCTWGGETDASGGTFGQSTTAVISAYSDTTCTTLADTEPLDGYTWVIERQSGQWLAQCTAANGLFIFYGTAPATDGDPCDGTITISNTLPAPGGSFLTGRSIASGGSVVFSPP